MSINSRHIYVKNHQVKLRFCKHGQSLRRTANGDAANARACKGVKNCLARYGLVIHGQHVDVFCQIRVPRSRMSDKAREKIKGMRQCSGGWIADFSRGFSDLLDK